MGSIGNYGAFRVSVCGIEHTPVSTYQIKSGATNYWDLFTMDTALANSIYSGTTVIPYSIETTWLIKYV